MQRSKSADSSSRDGGSGKQPTRLMLNTIDTIIAFAVIMTILSLLITVVVQMISAALSLRGKNLANALALTFQTIDPKIGDHAHSLAAQILRDPIFSDSIWRKKDRPTVVPNEKTEMLIDAEKTLKKAEEDLAVDPQNIATKSAVDDANAKVEKVRSDIQSTVTNAEKKLKRAEEGADRQNGEKQKAVKDAEAEVTRAKADFQLREVTKNRMEAWKFWTLRGGTLLGSAIRPGEIYRVLHEFADLTETEAALRDVPPDF